MTDLTKIIVFDTETNGLPRNYKAPPSDTDNWPRAIQVAWAVFDLNGVELKAVETLIQPIDFDIPDDAAKVHGITKEAAMAGRDIQEVLHELVADIEGCQVVAGHNIRFDLNIIESEICRMNATWDWQRPLILDTMLIGTNYCKLPGRVGYKWPKLEELYFTLFKQEMEKAHDALGDVRSTAKCLFGLINEDVISRSSLG